MERLNSFEARMTVFKKEYDEKLKNATTAEEKTFWSGVNFAFKIMALELLTQKHWNRGYKNEDGSHAE